MTSHTTERFRKLLAQLPKQIQKQAKEAYIQFEKKSLSSRTPFQTGTFEVTNLFSSHIKGLSCTGYTTGR